MSKLEFKGTTKECLYHYAENFLPQKGSHNSMVTKIPMAKFFGVVPSTITRWTSGQSKPLGEQLLKLRFFLEAVGYDVIEFRYLDDQVSYILAEMLVYGNLTIKDAEKHLGLNSSSILRIAHHNGNTSVERETKIRNMHENKKLVIQMAKSQLLKDFRITTNEQATLVPTLVQDEQEQFNDVSLATLAHLIQAIIPLLEKAVMSTTRDQRNNLRKLTGDEGMFRLSKSSSRLCSEKAREIINGH